MPIEPMPLGVGSTLWIAPSPRAVEEIRFRLASSGQFLLAPSVVTFESFATRILERAGRPTRFELSSRIVIEHAAKQLARDGKLDYFGHVIDTRGFLDGAAGLIRELEAANVAPDIFSAAIVDMQSNKLAACAELYAEVNASPLRHGERIGTGRRRNPRADAKPVCVGRDRRC